MHIPLKYLQNDLCAHAGLRELPAPIKCNAVFNRWKILSTSLNPHIVCDDFG